LTREIEAFLVGNADWLSLLVDDLVRFTPGTAEAIAPGVRYLTAGSPELLKIGDGPERWNRLQASALHQAKAALAAGRLEHAQLAAEAALAGLGVRIDWGTPEARLALARIARAQVRAYQQAVERSRGEPHDTPPRPMTPVTPVATDPVGVRRSNNAESAVLYLRDVKADWLALKTRQRPAIKIMDRSLRLMSEADIDVPLADLDRQHGAKLRAHLLSTGVKGQTVKNLLVPLQSLLNVAVDSGKLKANPWAGLRIDTSDSTQRLPWRTEDLKKLVTANNARKDPGRWLLPLGLYTAARIGELAQIEIADIQQVDGVWCIEVHDRKSEGHEKRTVKTKAGQRLIPVSQWLIALGFLKHAEMLREAGERFLFPGFIQGGKRLPGDLAGTDFLKLREAAGVALDERWTFHSLRHNGRSMLAAAHVNDQIIDKLIGHESGTVQGRYTHATTATLAEAVAKLDWTALDLR
jgi:integrase